MRKTIFWFIGILAVLFVILSALDTTGDYAAEQIIWKASKQWSDVAKNPQTVADQVVDKIIQQYEKAIRDFPKARITPMAHIHLGKIYLIRKDYEKARQEMQKVFEKYPQDANLCAQAASIVGSSYELQGNWPQALATYKNLRSNYPLTDLGLNVPLYIMNRYQKNGQSVNAQNAFKEALAYYNAVAFEHPHSEIEYKSLKLLSQCYLAQEQWHDALDVMSEILAKYPNPVIATPIINSMNTIVLTKIKDVSVGIDVYERFIQNNPKSALNKILSERIEALKQLEGKNIKIIATKK